VLYHSGEQEGKQTDERMHVDFLVGPVVLGPESQVLVVFDLAKDGFDLALAPVGQDDILGGPLVTVRDNDPLAEDLRLQMLESGVIDPVLESILTLTVWVVVDVEHLAEVLPGEEQVDALANRFRAAWSGAGLAQLFLPFRECLESFHKMLPEAADLAGTQTFADEEHHGTLGPPDLMSAPVHRHALQPAALRQGLILIELDGHEVLVMGRYEGGHVAEGRLIHQGLVGLRKVPLVVDHRELLEIHREFGQPFPDPAEGVGKEPGVDLVPLVHLAAQGDLSIPRDQQRKAEEADVMVHPKPDFSGEREGDSLALRAGHG